MTTCCKCNATVYAAEELWFNDRVYHKTCFRCSECRIQLRLNTVRSFNKEPYCQQHSPPPRKVEPPSKPPRVAEPVPVEMETRPTPTSDPAPLPPVERCHIVEAEKSDLMKSNVVEAVEPPAPHIPDAALPKQETTEPTTLRNSETRRTSEPEVAEAIDRKSILATGYDAVQTQIEMAAQSFTADPVTQKKIFNMFSEFNIIVCGAARVGKSTLINALCGRKLTQCSPGLDSCTRAISRYILREKVQINDQSLTYVYNFWDTPGFESWNERDIQRNFNNIIQKPKSDPLCVIYCASPGSFANTSQVKWLLDYCILERNILCALVITNKWAGTKQQRLAVLESYKKLLENYTTDIEEDGGITYFGNVALCAMVNTEPFIDEDNNVNRPAEGVDELVEAIMNSLQDEGKVFHWCMATIQKKGIINNLIGKAKNGLINTRDLVANLFGRKKKQK